MNSQHRMPRRHLARQESDDSAAAPVSAPARKSKAAAAPRKRRSRGDDDDDSVDSRGNIRGLIDYDYDSSSSTETSSDEEYRPPRAAAIKARKRIAAAMKEEERERKPRQLVVKPRARPAAVKEDSEEESEDSEDSEDEYMDEEEEEEEPKAGIVRINIGSFGTDEGDDPMVPKRHNMKKEPEIVKKFVELVTKPMEDVGIDAQIDQFKAMDEGKQKTLIEALERRPTVLDTGAQLMFKILMMQLPPEIQAMTMAKYQALQNMDPSTTEYFKQRNWLDKFCAMPFGTYKELPVRIEHGHEVCGQFMAKARSHLDAAVYGQEEAKLQILQFIASKVANPTARGLSLLLIGPPGIGKCHAKDTPILMADGSIKLVQDIAVGDTIMGDDFTSRTVLSLGRGQDMMYDIIPENGDTFRVNSEHILCLKTEGSTTGLIREISVKEYLKLPEAERAALRCYRALVIFPHFETNLNPYMVGAAAANTGNQIPTQYIRNSPFIRLNVLAGLIDNSLYRTALNTIYITYNTALNVGDILYLARSLGFGAYHRGTEIEIIGNISQIPTVSQKLESEPGASVKAMQTAFRVVEAGPGDYYGFTLDRNHRYLMGDFTVTHNTSLIKGGIAKAIDWPFQFISLGGDSDASTYTGHQLVYESSHAGKIVNSLVTAKSMSMVLMFDEVDKISQTPKGEEVANLLIHLTDPVQNGDFEDKYLAGVPIDLSKVMFVFSANDINKIDKVLLDRMNVIQLQGYSAKDKIIIAEQYLLPAALKEVNLSERIGLSKEVLTYMIETYASDETGVRELKRCIESVVQKINMLRMYNAKELPFYIKDFALPFVVKKEHIDLFLKKREGQGGSKVPLGMYI